MIQLHRSAVALANDALRDSEHPELRAFAETTIAARETELQLMISLLDELLQTSGRTAGSV